jgi:pimeloyl-[acyl-carrier protein] methyl ester esterase
MPGIFYRFFCLGLSAPSLQVMALKGVLTNVSSYVLLHRLRLIKMASFSSSSKVWTIPCGYLQGSHDKLVPARCAVWFAHHFQSFNLKKVDGPHFLLQMKAQECVKYILELDRHFQAAKDGSHNP